MGSALTNLWILAVLGSFGYFLYRVPAPLFVDIAAGGAAFLLIGFCGRYIPPAADGTRQGGAVTFLGTHSRSVGPGLSFIFQPFGIPIESVFKLVPLVESSTHSRRHFRVKSNETILLEISITYRPRTDRLWNYLSLEQSARDDAIKRRVETLLADQIHAREQPRDVVNYLAVIYEAVQADYMKRFSDEQGVSVRVLLHVPAMPANLAEG